MTPIEALQILVNMADAAMGNGADHRIKEQAIGVLRVLVEEETPVSQDTPSEKANEKK